MADQDGNDTENAREYVKSGLYAPRVCLEDHVEMLWYARLGVVPGISKMVDWLAHEILISSSFSS